MKFLDFGAISLKIITFENYYFKPLTMWTEENNQLSRTFEFENFIEAWAFMSKVAILAERHNHHPHWSNVYNKVRINLNTHSANDTVTHKDWELATAIDKVSGDTKA